MKPDIRNIDRSVIESFISARGEKRFRTGQIMEWIWKKGCNNFDQMTNLSNDLRNELKKAFRFPLAKGEIVQVSHDGTVKTGFRLEDGLLIEAVLIPSVKRNTACISSQAGCPLACKFCATGKLGFMRDLTPGEIFDQVVSLKRYAEDQNNGSLTNIVLMGMGEPLLNYDNVITAISHITSPDGLAISPQRLTLSTVGIAEKIKKLGDDGVKFNLAVSIHTANEMKRDFILPVNKSNPLELLSDALSYFHNKTGKRITFEYLLMENFNDGLADAKELARFCKIVPCKINLIEYNPIGDTRFSPSTQERSEQFKSFLESKNLVVNFRKSRGKDIDAACGQLANKASSNLII
jgi:23S rRNA (adenine2503-C2)-methyltransferase